MAAYTEIGLQKAQEILTLYGDYEPISLSALSLGISNSNYRIKLENHEDIVLKISNDKGVKELLGEQQLLLQLKENGFALSLTPYLTKAQSPVYELAPFHGVIYPFVSGEIPQISKETCYELGKALALLHLHANPIGQIRSHQTVGFDAEEIISYLSYPQCPQDFKEIFNTVFPDKLRRYLSTSLPKGIIHGDLYYDNVLMENGKVKHILDFEQGGVGTFIFDLGVSISGSALKDKKIDQILVQAQLEGYESIRPLTNEEKTLLSDSIKLGLFSIALWRIKRFNEKKLAPSKIDNYKELILRALEFSKNG